VNDTRPPHVRFASLLKKEMNNRRAFEETVRSFRPDLVYVWRMKHISMNMIFQAQATGLPVCYCVWDDWLANWDKADLWYSFWRGRMPESVNRRLYKAARLPLSLLKPLALAAGLLYSGPLKLRYAHFISRYMQQMTAAAGKRVERSVIIPWGVDPDVFPYREPSTPPRRLLFVGQVVPKKGVHTAVEALRILVHEFGYSDMTLTIVGGTACPEYPPQLRQMAERFGLQNHVQFAGPQPREAIPAIYSGHDILLFPSVWEEPFGVTRLEAMASGLPVVTTPTGGSTEVSQHEINALVFPKEDAPACAAQVRRLREDPMLCRALSQNARQLILERFALRGMVDAIEQDLLKCLGV
jgi:glycosyltransferase involved in cell wall biosynthesis